MNDAAVSVTASDLLTGSTSIPQPDQKLYAEDFPGVKIQPAFPGANYGRHPDTRKFVSLKPRPGGSAVPPLPPTPAPAAPAAPPTAVLPVETPPESADIPRLTGDPVPPVEPSPPPPEASGPPPDFSGLPKSESIPNESGGTGPQPGEQPGSGPGAGQPAPDPAAASGSHRALATMLWRMIVAMLATVFGKEWFPRKKGPGPDEIPYDEEEMVISAAVDYFQWVGMVLLNPLERLCLAVGTYCMARIFTVMRWWKNRKEKQAPEPEPRAADQPIDIETVKQQQEGAPASNFPGNPAGE